MPVEALVFGLLGKFSSATQDVLEDIEDRDDEYAESKSKINQAKAMLERYEELDEVDAAILEPLRKATGRLEKMYTQAEEAQKSYEESDVSNFKGIISHFTGKYTDDLDVLQKAVNAEMIALRAFRDTPLPTLLSNNTQNVVKTEGGLNSVPKDQPDTLRSNTQRATAKQFYDDVLILAQLDSDDTRNFNRLNSVPKDESEKEHRSCSLWD